MPPLRAALVERIVYLILSPTSGRPRCGSRDRSALAESPRTLERNTRRNPKFEDRKRAVRTAVERESLSSISFALRASSPVMSSRTRSGIHTRGRGG